MAACSFAQQNAKHMHNTVRNVHYHFTRSICIESIAKIIAIAHVISTFQLTVIVAVA